MIEALFYFFCGIFAIAFAAWVFTLVCEYIGMLSDYATEQAKKRYAEERRKREAQERREIEDLMLLFTR